MCEPVIAYHSCYIPILIAEFSSDRKLMGDLDVPGGHALRAPVETLRQRDWSSEAPFNVRTIYRRLLSREIDGLRKQGLSLCSSDKPHVVSRWFRSSSVHPRSLFLNHFGCNSVELGVFQQRCKPAFHRECATKGYIPISNGETILDIFVGVTFESLGIYSQFGVANSKTYPMQWTNQWAMWS